MKPICNPPFTPRRHNLHLPPTALERITQLVDNILRDDETYPKKMRTTNFYKKLSKDLKTEVDAILARYPQTQGLVWHYEIFMSREPVGLHNDRNFFLGERELCEQGFIIPLHWSGEVPKTYFYDLYIDQKVNWDGVGFSNLQKQKVSFDPTKLVEPTQLQWEANTIIFFDSRQIHQASDFRRSSDDYKLSINGLGYSIVSQEISL